MLISLNWIKDYVDIDENINIKDLCYKITISTAEVEGYEVKGQDIKGVVVGKIIKVEQHPDSDKYKIITVDIGEKEPVKSVCGDPTVKEGSYIPYAKVGGSIKKIPDISKVEIAGVESNGIACSTAEIGISDVHEKVLELEGEYKTGTDIKNVIPIEDIIIEIDNKSLTHRPDLWGHYGMAREIAAILNKKLKPLPLIELKKNTNLPQLNIKIEDTKKCFRFVGITVDNVNAKKSPIAMQIRLYYCGERPIFPLVDISNYVMLDIGQPNHTYDRRYVDSIIVKTPGKNIKFMTLDDIERDINADTLMIYREDEPIGIAGIMGGKKSSIFDDTNSLFLEAASFDSYSVRKSSTEIGLRTEASTRFEKTLDPEFALTGVKRFLHLLKDMQSDIKITSNLTDVYVKKIEPITIEIEKDYIDRYIGNKIDDEKIIQILESIEFNVEKSNGAFKVLVPTFRATKDITLKVDIIEEITRIYGYDNIISETIKVPLKPLQYNQENIYENHVKNILAEKFAYTEVNSYIWYDEDFNGKVGIKETNDIEIVNPHSSALKVLRKSMVPYMLFYASENAKNFESFSLFEIGKVFESVDKKCNEHRNLSIILGDKKQREEDLFYELKGVISYLTENTKGIKPEFAELENNDYSWTHPVKSIKILLENEELGYITVINPAISRNIAKKINLAVLEIHFDKLFEVKAKERKYIEPSKYPEVDLDFSFLIDKDIQYSDVNDYIKEFKKSILIKYDLLDIYTGKNIPADKKNFTFRLTIGSRNKTLSSEEIDLFSNEFIRYMKLRDYQLR